MLILLITSVVMVIIPSCDERGGQDKKSQHEQSICKQIFNSVPPDNFDHNDDDGDDEYCENHQKQLHKDVQGHEYAMTCMTATLGGLEEFHKFNQFLDLHCIEKDYHGRKAISALVQLRAFPITAVPRLAI